MFFGPLFLILVYLGQTTLMTLASLFALIVIACSFGIGGHMLGKALKKMGGKNPKVFEKGQRVIKTARLIMGLICLLIFWSLIYTIFGKDYTTLVINNIKIFVAYALMNTCTWCLNGYTHTYTYTHTHTRTQYAMFLVLIPQAQNISQMYLPRCLSLYLQTLVCR